MSVFIIWFKICSGKTVEETWFFKKLQRNSTIVCPNHVKTCCEISNVVCILNFLPQNSQKSAAEKLQRKVSFCENCSGIPLQSAVNAAEYETQLYVTHGNNIFRCRQNSFQKCVRGYQFRYIQHRRFFPFPQMSLIRWCWKKKEEKSQCCQNPKTSKWMTGKKKRKKELSIDIVIQ